MIDFIPCIIWIRCPKLKDMVQEILLGIVITLVQNFYSRKYLILICTVYQHILRCFYFLVKNFTILSLAYILINVWILIKCWINFRESMILNLWYRNRKQIKILFSFINLFLLSNFLYHIFLIFLFLFVYCHWRLMIHLSHLIYNSEKINICGLLKHFFKTVQIG